MFPFTINARREDAENDLGRFEFLIDDYETSAHRAVIANDIELATLARGLIQALREHVELRENEWPSSIDRAKRCDEWR